MALIKSNGTEFTKPEGIEEAQYNGKTPYEMFVFSFMELAEKLGLKNIDRNDVILKP